MLNHNPHQFAFVAAVLPADLLDEKYVVAHATWELERIPQDWIEALRIVDEVWVPSRFVHDAFINSNCPVPVRTQPYLLELPECIEPERTRFGLPERTFIVASSFSVSSGIARKNPTACIQAFQRAFPSDEPAVLLLKISAGSLGAALRAELLSVSGGDPRIILYDRLFSDAETYDLLSCCDVILSLHRSEGFGMIPAQGMLLGKPVVATGWSGNMDFMSKDCAELVPFSLVPVNDPQDIYESCSLRWAEPDIDAAAAALRRCFESKGYCATLGARARKYSGDYFARATQDASATFRGWGEKLPDIPSDHGVVTRS